MTAKKVTQRKTAAPRKTAKTIRNLRGTLVHLRLFSDQNEKPYRVELQPRGKYGDVHTVPASLTDTSTFVDGVNVLFEIITKSESDKIQYQEGGYQGGVEPATLVRNEDTVIKTVADLGTDGKPLRNQGPTYPDVPGSDKNLHAKLRENNAALPEGALEQPVRIERTKG